MLRYSETLICFYFIQGKMYDSQLRLRQNGWQGVPTNFGLALSVVGAHVAHTLLVRVHVLHVVAPLTGQGDLG